MKKLMIAAAIVCAAALSQAASVTWNTTVAYKPADASGTFATGSANRVAPSGFYVWVIGVNDSTVFDALDLTTAYNDYYVKEAAGRIDGEIKSMKGSASQDGYSAGDSVYALSILTYNDGTKDWYVANKSWGTIGSVSAGGDSITIGALHTILGGNGNAGSFTGSGTAITGWTAVPEPTSGLLLLLGVAGLALRRRRA